MHKCECPKQCHLYEDDCLNEDVTSGCECCVTLFDDGDGRVDACHNDYTIHTIEDAWKELSLVW
jgi:hypothetical protein